MMRTDEAYGHALAAKRGTAVLPQELTLLADRVAERYGVRPLWISADAVPVSARLPSVRPRLDVIFERSAELTQFMPTPYGFDGKRQDAIASDVVSLVPKSEMRRMFHAPSGRRMVGTVFVVFSAFDRAALQDVHQSVAMEAIDALGARCFGDAYWQASRLWSAPTLFLQTDAQVADYKDSSAHLDADAGYRELVAPYDEFGYLQPSEVFVQLDSKQNFDDKYESNWYYYWK